jgi:predicted RNA-binding Zn ribbon-like protein
MSTTPAKTAFPAVAGHPALDLVDTVHWRLDAARSIDTLATYDDAVAWCEQFGLLSGGPEHFRLAAVGAPDAAAREHAAVRTLREAIYSAVFESSEDAAGVIVREYLSALDRSRLERAADGATWSWRMPADITGPRAAVATVAYDLLRSDLSGARQCADDACGWVYLDTSPRHNRVWCTSAGCGNRNRVARHQARKRA